MQKVVIHKSGLIRAQDYPGKLEIIGTVRVLSASTVRVAQVVRCADVLDLDLGMISFWHTNSTTYFAQAYRRHSLPNNQLSFYS